MAGGANVPDPKGQLLAEVFRALDQQQRGFISRLELAQILDAMQADSGSQLGLPESLRATATLKDSRLLLSDLQGLLKELSVLELEDLKWFAQSVVTVEAELREVWALAVKRWKDSVEVLYARDLHSHILPLQPQRVARWLLLRTSFESKPEQLQAPTGLGMSQKEVEVLFADDTADDINRCCDSIDPFVQALGLLDQLREAALAGDAAGPCPAESESQVLTLLQQLTPLADQSFELACLMVHQELLGFLVAIVRSGSFSQSVVASSSSLLTALLSHRVHERAREYEKRSSQLAAAFLEVDTPLLTTAEVSLQKFHSWRKVPHRLGLDTRDPARETVADWVHALLTLEVDADRGDMLEHLIRFDERRLLLVADGGLRQDEKTPVAESVFSYGRTSILLLSRVDISNHHTQHERRTPLRSHIWRFLLNIFASSVARGQQLFRAAGGMRVVCAVLRGNTYGLERAEVSLEEEHDALEELGYAQSYPSRPRAAVEVYHGPIADHRFYPSDFLDDKFYGPQDRHLATALLEYMANSAMWGEEALVEEMMQYPNTLQVLCKVNPPSCFLLSLLLKSKEFPEHLHKVSYDVASAEFEQTLRPLTSGHPLLLTSGREKMIEAAHQELAKADRKTVKLRILARGYHDLQTSLEALNLPIEEGGSPEEAEAVRAPVVQGIRKCCSLLSSRVPLSADEVLDVAAGIHLKLEEVLLRVARLPPGREAPSHLSADLAELRDDLSLVQLLRYGNESAAPFLATLQVRLERVFASAGPEDQAPEDGAGAQVFQLGKVPLKASLLRSFPRSSPTDVVVGLQSTLKLLADSLMAHNKDELLALVFDHFCYLEQPAVAFEADSLEALLGLSQELLTEVQAQLGNITPKSSKGPKSVGASVLQVQANSTQVAFVRLRDTWQLWANGGSPLANSVHAVSHFSFSV